MAAYFARAALQRCAQVAGVAATSVATATYCDAALNKKDFTALVVARNDTIGKNVHKVTLAFPDPSDTLGMTCAGMLMVEGEKRDGSGVIARPYTPVSRDNTVGRMELVVKDYPGIGNVSSDICAKKVGDTVRVKGCFTKIKIEANKWKRVGLVAGGSGLTPCLQVVEELLSLPEDKTQIDLIFCNKDEGDIYLKDHLDALAASNPRFTVKYCVDAPLGKFWSWFGGLQGYVDAQMVKEHLPPPGEGTVIMVCGPPPMYKAICGPKKFEKGKPPAQGELAGVLKDLGYTAEMCFKF